jgi:hypothetical protein
VAFHVLTAGKRPDDGGSRHFLNVGILVPYYTVTHPEYRHLWEEYFVNESFMQLVASGLGDFINKEERTLLSVYL